MLCLLLLTILLLDDKKITFPKLCEPSLMNPNSCKAADSSLTDEMELFVSLCSEGSEDENSFYSDRSFFIVCFYIVQIICKERNIMIDSVMVLY